MYTVRYAVLIVVLSVHGRESILVASLGKHSVYSTKKKLTKMKKSAKKAKAKSRCRFGIMVQMRPCQQWHPARTGPAATSQADACIAKAMSAESGAACEAAGRPADSSVESPRANGLRHRSLG